MIKANTRKELLALKALQESEEKFRGVFNNSYQFAALIDSEGNIKMVNKASLGLIGISESEVIEKPFWDAPWWIPDQKELKRLKENFERAVSGEFIRYETTHRSSEDKLHFIDFSLKPIHDEKGTVNCLIAEGRDITEIKRARERAEEVLNTTSILFLKHNLITREYEYISPSISDITGYTASELRLADRDLITEKIHPEDIQPYKRQMRELMNGVYESENHTASIAVRFKKKGGDYIWLQAERRVQFDHTGNPSSSVDSYRDITKEKEIEAALTYRGDFESLILELSTRFIDISYRRIDREIEAALEKLGRFCGSSSTNIFEFSDDRSIFNMTHLWRDEHVTIEKDDLQNLSSAEMPWWTGMILNQKPVAVQSVDNLPDEAGIERAILQSHGIKSLVDVPMVYQGRVIGFMGIETDKDNRKWTEDEITLLKIVSQAFTNALQRKKGEEALRESEERFRNVYDTAPLAFVVWDTNAIVKDWNKKAEDLYGWSKEEIVGQNFFNFLIPEKDRPQIEEVVGRLINGDILNSTINNNLTKNGELITCEWNNSLLHDNNGNVIGAISLGLDITERRKADEKLAKYEHLVSASQDMMALIDRNLVFQACSKAYAEYYFRTRNSVIGHTVEEVMGRENYEKTVRANIERCLSGQEIRYQTWMEHTDGSRRFMDIIFFPHYEEGVEAGVVSDFGISARDMTEMKHLEEKLRQSYKMEAIGTLAGGIAHDFNNILSAVIGYSELSENLATDPELKFNIDQIKQAGKRAAELVKQILTFSRQSEQDIKPLQITFIIKEALKLLRSSLPSTITIEREFKSSNYIMADSTQINQIVMNLCTNSAYAMKEEGGTLTVRLEDIEIDPVYALKHPEFKIGKYVKLTVIDTGCGMSPESIKRIFDPFYTTKPKDEGTGMGLSLVHGIVKSYGGAITVYSRPGKGTTFNAFFPAAGDIKPDQTEEVFAPIPMGSERILFIDDEEAIVELSRQMLERLGYQVTSFSSSTEALKVFSEKPGDFDVVITDLTMPNITGDKLSAEIIKIRPDIPIIMATGFSEKIGERDLERLGIRKVILKPVVMREIGETIREVLEKPD